MEQAWNSMGDDLRDDAELFETAGVCSKISLIRDPSDTADMLINSDGCLADADDPSGSEQVEGRTPTGDEGGRGEPRVLQRSHSETFLGEACSKDHVKAEERMDAEFPLRGPVFPEDLDDRGKELVFHWVDTKDIGTLVSFLESQEDFVRIQALYGLKERTRGNQIDCTDPNMVFVLTETVCKSKDVLVKRLASGLVASLLQIQYLKHKVMCAVGLKFLRRLVKIVTDQGKIVTDGKTRSLIANCLAVATKNDLQLTGFFIRNFNLYFLFECMQATDTERFKVNILQVILNILQHPLGIEILTSTEGFCFDLILQAFASLIPEYHQISFEILNILLRVSRKPHQDKIHTKFIKFNGVKILTAVLEETYLYDTQVALHALVLLDHLADGKKGVHVLVCKVINLLKSIAFHSNSRGSAAGTPSDLNKTKKIEKCLPVSLHDAIREYTETDKYNSLNAPVYPESICDSRSLSEILQSKDLSRTKIVTPQKSGVSVKLKPVSSPKKQDKKNDTKQKNSLFLIAQRIGWRLKHYSPFINLDNLADCSQKYLEYSSSALGSQPIVIDNSLKIMAMEVLAKLTSHSQGVKETTGYVRNLCPLLKKARDSMVIDFVGYCLQLICQNNNEYLHDLLIRYYLIRELIASLKAISNDRAKASLLSALAALLKKSCPSVYNLPKFSIRMPLIYWLRKTPSEAPAYACLNNLIIIYNMARVYECRDYITGKSVVSNLFRIIQDSETEEIVKIYAICSVAFLTFANKRYKKPSVRTTKYLSHGINESAIDEEIMYDPSGPYPTVDSFISAEIDDQLFIQLRERDNQCPCNFFIIFLLEILLKRAPAFIAPYIFKHHQNFIEWLARSLDQKQPMASYLYSTLMRSIPTLSFYHDGIVYPWSRIDTDDFYICVDEDKHGTFSRFLANNGHDSDPIYCVYNLSKTEKIMPTPWEKYWKECYEDPKEETTIPNFGPSLFYDSIFGLGRMYRTKNEDEPFIVYTKKIRDLKPQHTENYFIFHPEVNEERKSKKVQSIYSRTLFKREDLNQHFTKKRKVTSSPKQIILPNLFKYKKHLIKNLPLCKFFEDNKYEVSPEQLSTFKKCKMKNIEKQQLNCLLQLKEFYRPHIKSFSKYHFKLLTKKLKQCPQLWNKFSQFEDEMLNKNNEKPAQFKKLVLLLKNFPNYFLEKIEIPIFKRRQTADRDACIRSKMEINPYNEGINVFSTLILDTYERLTVNSIPLLKRPHNIVQNYYSNILWFDDKKMPVDFSHCSNWIQQLNSFGKDLITRLEKPNDKFYQSIVRYDFPESKIMGSYHSTLSLAIRSSKLPKLRASSSIQLTDKIQLKKKKKPETSNAEKSVSVLSKSVETPATICDLYLPTSTELFTDLFFQSADDDLRGFRCLPKSQSEITNSSKKITIDNLTRIKLKRENYLLKRNIDYEYEDQDIEELSSSIDSQESASLSRPEQNPNFVEFCDFVKSRVDSILKKTTEVECWYSEILKFIAQSVCLRLEGPYETVDEHIMDQHRQELRRLLGTSIIPFGRLRIGGQLERAVLFKFLADRLLIPCGLYRESFAKAWVEVPRHPFLFPLCGTCIVNLTDAPGHLIKGDSQEAYIYKGYSLKTQSESQFEEECSVASEISKSEDSIENLVHSVKVIEGKEEESKKLLQRKLKMFFTSIVSESTIDMNHENSMHCDLDISDEKKCSNIISKEHFLETDSKEKTSFKNKENILPQEQFIEEAEVNRVRENTFVPATFNENLLKFSWKSDPHDAFTLIIGNITDASFTGRELAYKSENYYYEDTRLNSEHYVRTNTENELNSLFTQTKKHGPTINVPLKKHYSDDREIEITDFEDWKNVLNKLKGNQTVID